MNQDKLIADIRKELQAIESIVRRYLNQVNQVNQ